MGQFAVDTQVGTKTLNCKYNHDDDDTEENVFALTCSWSTVLGKLLVLAKLRFEVRDIDDDARDDDDSSGLPSGTCSYADSGEGATESCCIASIAPTANTTESDTTLNTIPLHHVPGRPSVLVH
jgi:hypothetical protein